VATGGCASTSSYVRGKTAILENVAAGALTVGTTDAQNLQLKTNNVIRAPKTNVTIIFTKP
jgi:hypothetical protein